MSSLLNAAQNKVDEIFCGYQDITEKSSFMKILNRREMASANILSFGELDMITAKAHSLGLRVFIALNEICTSVQYSRVDPFLRKITAFAVDGLIVSDFALLLYVNAMFPGRFEIHMGVGALTLNPETAKFYQKHGAKRVILSRKIFTEDILSIRRKVPDMEIEVFIQINAFCPNFDGACNYSHNNSISPFSNCNEVDHHIVWHGIDRVVDVDNCGCNLCALWDYSRSGIDYLKVAVREIDEVPASDLIAMVRSLLALVTAVNKRQFVDAAVSEYRKRFGHVCPNYESCVCAKEYRYD